MQIKLNCTENFEKVISFISNELNITALVLPMFIHDLANYIRKKLGLIEAKLNCNNRVWLQGKVSKLTDGKFIIKSEQISIPCRVDCRLPDGLKDGDFIQISAKLRYSNDHDTHKLILDKVRICAETNTPVNEIVIEGYQIQRTMTGKGIISYMLRNNTLTNDGSVYRCLIEIIGYGKVAEKMSDLHEGVLYEIVGNLVLANGKIKVNVEYTKPSKEIIRDV